MALNTTLIKEIAQRHGADLFDLIALKRDLEKEIGKHVDVVTEGALSPYIKENVLREARPL
jgi:predicted nucleotidyltransferase